MDDLNRKRHAVYKLTYHAVFVIKYRRRVMTEPIITHMRQYATHLIEQCYQGKLLELNGEPDHIHILFELPATAAPSVVVCSLKTQLSKEVRAKFWDEIKDKLWKDSFWSDSYFITTTGGANIETLERYIQDQGIEKPKRKYTKRQAKKMWKYHCTWYWFIFYAAFIPARLCRTRFSAENWINVLLAVHDYFWKKYRD